MLSHESHANREQQYWSKTIYQVSAKTSPDKNTSNVFSNIDKYYYIVNPGKRLCAAANNL